METIYEKEIQLNERYYAQVSIDGSWGGGKTDITVLKMNDKGYDWFCKNRVITYQHINANVAPSKGEAGYDPFCSSNDESESLTSFSDEAESAVCTALLIKAGLIDPARQEAIVARNERVALRDSGVKSISAADMVEEALQSGRTIRQMALAADEEERAMYGGLTYQEFQDEL